MRTINRVLWLSVLFCTACSSGSQPPPNDGTPTPVRLENLESQSQLCNPHCERLEYARRGDLKNTSPFKLTVPEEGSLKAAMQNTPVPQGVQTTHLHADAVNGKLVFTPDSPNDPTRDSHLSDNDIVLSNPNGNVSKPVRVVATPAAVELMKARTGK